MKRTNISKQLLPLLLALPLHIMASEIPRVKVRNWGEKYAPVSDLFQVTATEGY